MTKKVKAVPEKLLSLVVIVISTKQNWGKAETLDEALKYARKPKHYVAWLAHPKTMISEIDGSLTYPRGFRPKKLIEKLPKAKPGKNA